MDTPFYLRFGWTHSLNMKYILFLMIEFSRTLNGKKYQFTKMKFVMDNFVLMGIIISKWKLIKHIERKWYSFHVRICLFLFDQIIIWKFNGTFSTTSTIDDNLVICILQIAVLIDEHSVVFLYSNYDLKGSFVIFEFYWYYHAQSISWICSNV